MTDDGFDPRDERVTAYLRSRSSVQIPPDLMQTAMQQLEPQATASTWPRPREFLAGLVAALALIVVAVTFVVNLPQPAVVSNPEASVSPQPQSTEGFPTPTRISPATSQSIFPSFVSGMPFGMPVVSVAQAVALLNAGKLDGRAVAVAGYFAEEFLPCPAPFGFVAPLEDWCRAVAFTDDDLGLGMDNPMGWNIPAGEANLSPYLVAETAGQESLRYDTGSQPLVLVGHADDPRQWQCSPEAKAQCAGDFVVDRIAWANGAPIQLSPATTNVPIRMSLNDLAQATGSPALLMADAIKASDAWTIDPRFHAVGDNTVWVMRSLTSTITTEPDDGTRRVRVWLVDDATGAVLGQDDLALSPTYQPARLSIQATRPPMNGSDDIYPFYRLSEAGKAVLEADTGGSTYGSPSETRYGPGLPAILDPGSYTVEAWLATVDWTSGNDIVGKAYDNCSTDVTLNALDDVRFQAAFPKTGACTWGPAPSESPF